MSTTFPFEFNGVEYVADVVVSKTDHEHHFDYFIKINGDDFCFLNLSKTEDTYLIEQSASDDLSFEIKEAIKKALRSQKEYPYAF